MLIKKRLQYVEWLYTGTKTTRMLVIQLIPGNKKAGESVGGEISSTITASTRGH